MAAAAVKAEAKGEGFTVEFDGESYVIPPALDWDLEALEALEEGRVVAAVRALLGDEGWARFREKRRTVRDLNEFFELAAGAAGLGN